VVDQLEHNAVATDKNIRKIADQVTEIKDNIRKIAIKIASNPAAQNSEVDSDGIPFAPLQTNFKHLKHWEQGTYQAARANLGTAELNPGTPLISSYMEDQFGNNISEGVKAALRGDLFAYWTGLHRNREPITNWKDLDLDMKERFRAKFEKAYGWLRLCEGHWKVDHLWINYFGSWKRSRMTPVPDPGLDPKNRPHATAVVTEGSDASTGSKRGHEEPEGASETFSKCRRGPYKGKDKEAFPLTEFHHTSRKSKKFPAKLAKVCLFWFLFTADAH
jgi:hypothetical protein